MHYPFYSLPLALVLVAGLAIPAAADKDLRVMSFNIRFGTARDGDNHWEKRKAFVAETIAKYDPDLLGTQETLGFQKAYLQEHLSGYTAIGVGRNDGKSEGEMTALFYRTERFEEVKHGHFWLSKTPGAAGSKSWDSSLPRMCTWVRLKDRTAPRTRPVLFINTHFDHRGKQARLESARLIRKKASELGSDCHVIVTGDFNAAVGSDPYQALFGSPSGQSDTAPPLNDSYRLAPRNNPSPEATFSGFRASVTKGARIDWIAVGGNWKVIRAEIDRTQRDGRTPSDHYPVTATLRRSTTGSEK